MSSNGPVKIQVDERLATSGAASNVATNQATAEALKAAGNIDGKSVYPEWVTTRGISLAESLRVGDGVTLTDGCVTADYLASDSVTADKLNASSVTASELSLSGSLSSFNITNLGTISTGSIGVGAGGVTISNDGGSSGIYIGANQIFTKYGGSATVLIDGTTGIITANSFQMTAEQSGGSYVAVKNGATTIAALDATSGILVNNSQVTPSVLERLSLQYGGSEISYFYAYGSNSYWVNSGGLNSISAASISLVSNNIYLTGGTITVQGSITGVTNLTTSGSISCGTTLDMTSGNISNAASISGSNCSVYALHLARDTSYKADTSFSFYAASSSGGSPTVQHTVTFKDGLITSWSAA